jgi:hypothetical protein
MKRVVCLLRLPLINDAYSHKSLNDANQEIKDSIFELKQNNKLIALFDGISKLI